MITCSQDTPLYLLKRVAERYGAVGNDGYSLTVVANDEESEELISKTLLMLGFGIDVTPDPEGGTVHQLRPAT